MHMGTFKLEKATYVKSFEQFFLKDLWNSHLDLNQTKFCFIIHYIIAHES